MRFLPALLCALLCAFFLAWNVQAIMYLTSGTDSYGQGISYPGYKQAPAIADFVRGDHTSRMGAVFLGSTFYRPEFASINSINRSDYYMLWAQGLNFSFFAPFLLTYYVWKPLASEGYDRHIPAIQEFVQPDWRPAKTDYQIPALQEFMQDDWKPPRPDTENYAGLEKFLEDE